MPSLKEASSAISLLIVCTCLPLDIIPTLSIGTPAIEKEQSTLETCQKQTKSHLAGTWLYCSSGLPNNYCEPLNTVIRVNWASCVLLCAL